MFDRALSECFATSETSKLLKSTTQKKNICKGEVISSKTSARAQLAKNREVRAGYRVLRGPENYRCSNIRRAMQHATFPQAGWTRHRFTGVHVAQAFEKKSNVASSDAKFVVAWSFVAAAKQGQPLSRAYMWYLRYPRGRHNPHVKKSLKHNTVNPLAISSIKKIGYQIRVLVHE